jgi:16S rRNA (cytidine1402-2'-O)-methyltransferase
MTCGVLFLIPAAISDPKGTDSGALVAATLPPATLEAITKLRMFAVEHAKSARAFLKSAGSPFPMQSIDITEIGHAPDVAMVRPLIEALKAGSDVGLLSESGCPAVADPGALLVRLAHESGIRVVPLVGPSSLLLAVMASGLDGQRFAFCGYLPVKPDERASAIRELEVRSRRGAETQIAIETPYRNAALFTALLGALQPGTRLTVAIDLTMPTETILMKRVAEWRKTLPPALDRRQAVFLFLAS